MATENNSNITAEITASVYTTVPEVINEHINNTSNPHIVTKAQVGLENVDNTADMDKPISSLQQAALDTIAEDITAINNNVDTITSDYIKSTDCAAAEGDYGLVKLGGTGTGLAVGKAGGLYVVGVRDDEIESESTSSYRTLQAQHISKVVKKGMTSNTQEWTDEDKANARTLIDAVGKTDYGNESTHGVIKVSPACGTFTNDGILNIRRADNSDIDAKEQKYRPIVPANLDYAVKSGISNNSLEWTNEEQTAARTQIDAVGKSDYASFSNHGIVKVMNSAGTFCNEGIIYLYKALESDIDAKEQKYRPIVPANLDYAIKEGLANNRLEWTEEEKAAARTIIDAPKKEPNPNLFHNAEFKVNQRGKTTYAADSTATDQTVCVDRWRKDPNTIVTVLDNGGITFSNTSTSIVSGISQFIFETERIVGKKITITMKTPDKTYIVTTDVLPELPQSTNLYQTIQTIETDFGYIEIYYGAYHFAVKFMQNCPTTAEEATAITVEWMKAEIGTEATDLPLMTEEEVEDICRYFYMPGNNNVLSNGYVKFTEAESLYYFTVPLAHHMYEATKIESPSLTGYVTRNGVLTKVTFDSIESGGRSNDKSYQVLKCTLTEDNTTKLNGATELWEPFFGRYVKVFFDAEPYR